MRPTTATAPFDVLCTAADRRAWRVLLRLEGRGTKVRLSRLAIADRDGQEVAAARIARDSGGLQRSARALLEYLEELDKREAA